MRERRYAVVYGKTVRKVKAKTAYDALQRLFPESLIGGLRWEQPVERFGTICSVWSAETRREGRVWVYVPSSEFTEL